MTTRQNRHETRSGEELWLKNLLFSTINEMNRKLYQIIYTHTEKKRNMCHLSKQLSFTIPISHYLNKICSRSSHLPFVLHSITITSSSRFYFKGLRRRKDFRVLHFTFFFISPAGQVFPFLKSPKK